MFEVVKRKIEQIREIGKSSGADGLNIPAPDSESGPLDREQLKFTGKLEALKLHAQAISRSGIDPEGRIGKLTLRFCDSAERAFEALQNDSIDSPRIRMAISCIDPLLLGLVKRAAEFGASNGGDKTSPGKLTWAINGLELMTKYFENLNSGPRLNDNLEVIALRKALEGMAG